MNVQSEYVNNELVAHAHKYDMERLLLIKKKNYLFPMQCYNLKSSSFFLFSVHKHLKLSFAILTNIVSLPTLRLAEDPAAGLRHGFSTSQTRPSLLVRSPVEGCAADVQDKRPGQRQTGEECRFAGQEKRFGT